MKKIIYLLVIIILFSFKNVNAIIVDGFKGGYYFKNGENEQFEQSYYFKRNTKTRIYTYNTIELANQEFSFYQSPSSLKQKIEDANLQKIMYYGYGYLNHDSPEWYTTTQIFIWNYLNPRKNKFHNVDINGNGQDNFQKENEELSNLLNQPVFSFNNNQTIINESQATFEDTNKKLNMYEIVQKNDLDISLKDDKLILNNLKSGKYQIILKKKGEEEQIQKYQCQNEFVLLRSNNYPHYELLNFEVIFNLSQKEQAKDNNDLTIQEVKKSEIKPKDNIIDVNPKDNYLLKKNKQVSKQENNLKNPNTTSLLQQNQILLIFIIVILCNVNLFLSVIILIKRSKVQKS
jgi:hypothetical protein